MDASLHVYVWLQIVSAVIVGAGFSAAFIISALHIHKIETRDGHSRNVPFWVFAGLAIPPIFAAIGIYLLRA